MDVDKERLEQIIQEVMESSRVLTNSGSRSLTRDVLFFLSFIFQVIVLFVFFWQKRQNVRRYLLGERNQSNNNKPGGVLHEHENEEPTNNNVNNHNNQQQPPAPVNSNNTNNEKIKVPDDISSTINIEKNVEKEGLVNVGKSVEEQNIIVVGALKEQELDAEFLPVEKTIVELNRKIKGLEKTLHRRKGEYPTESLKMRLKECISQITTTITDLGQINTSANAIPNKPTKQKSKEKFDIFTWDVEEQKKELERKKEELETSFKEKLLIQQQQNEQNTSTTNTINTDPLGVIKQNNDDTILIPKDNLQAAAEALEKLKPTQTESTTIEQKPNQENTTKQEINVNVVESSSTDTSSNIQPPVKSTSKPNIPPIELPVTNPQPVTSVVTEPQPQQQPQHVQEQQTEQPTSGKDTKQTKESKTTPRTSELSEEEKLMELLMGKGATKAGKGGKKQGGGNAGKLGRIGKGKGMQLEQFTGIFDTPPTTIEEQAKEPAVAATTVKEPTTTTQQEVVESDQSNVNTNKEVSPKKDSPRAITPREDDSLALLSQQLAGISKSKIKRGNTQKTLFDLFETGTDNKTTSTTSKSSSSSDKNSEDELNALFTKQLSSAKLKGGKKGGMAGFADQLKDFNFGDETEKTQQQKPTDVEKPSTPKKQTSSEEDELNALFTKQLSSSKLKGGKRGALAGMADQLKDFNFGDDEIENKTTTPTKQQEPEPTPIKNIAKSSGSEASSEAGGETSDEESSEEDSTKKNENETADLLKMLGDVPSLKIPGGPVVDTLETSSSSKTEDDENTDINDLLAKLNVVSTPRINTGQEKGESAEKAKNDLLKQLGGAESEDDDDRSVSGEASDSETEDDEEERQIIDNTPLVKIFGSAGDINTSGLKRAKKVVSMAGAGKPRYQMEDEWLTVYPFKNSNDRALFCIFDGHSGKSAAVGAKSKFPDIFDHLLTSTENWSNKTDLSEIFDQAFLDTDQQLLECEYEGTTATTVYLWKVESGEKYLQVANVGDSSAVLVCEGEADLLTQDHRPTLESERERIQASGVKLEPGQTRLNGLAVSRALGDHFPKEMKCGIVANPSVSKPIKLTKKHTHLIVASDGLWDVIRPQKAYDIIKDEEDPEKMAKLLLRTATKSSKCNDNVSVIVVLL